MPSQIWDFPINYNYFLGCDHDYYQILNLTFKNLKTENVHIKKMNQI